MGVVGIDMFIAFTDKKYNRDVVRQACVGLDFGYEGRNKMFYSEALETGE